MTVYSKNRLIFSLFLPKITELFKPPFPGSRGYPERSFELERKIRKIIKCSFFL